MRIAFAPATHDHTNHADSSNGVIDTGSTGGTYHATATCQEADAADTAIDVLELGRVETSNGSLAYKAQ